MAWWQPAPPKQPGFLKDDADPGFSALNLFDAPLEPEQTVVGHHDAQNFTRIYGSIGSDQPLIVTILFANDEVDAKGYPISDETIAGCHYDAHALTHLYDPDKQSATGKYFTMIFGRWMQVSVTNKGKGATEELRVAVRGSVF